MITKEEILNSFIKTKGHVGGMTEGDKNDIVYPAMHDYAKKECMEFIRWANGSIHEIRIPLANGKWEILRPTPVRTPNEESTDNEIWIKFLQERNE